MQKVANLVQIGNRSVLQVRVVKSTVQIFHPLLFQLAYLRPPLLKLFEVDFCAPGVVLDDDLLDYLDGHLFGGGNKLFKVLAEIRIESFPFSEYNKFY